ncbi:Acetylornithine deacetylase/Succinyl-diaminopimelate desuccinylase [Pseudooceanicola antarcticus]|uniref:Acetylornithine deacetylase/Succinyl-diaminopimelate desuccinylase n=1 Tax=Pseudooceanicola antarcticus TaxID=1247613 RepID=A0A285IVY6_9RHOB|nr:dipeptidase [Pseudooceanicola antarcticus]PJE32019.1 dipeptidase [Pseudooceanicola antarcticus]SNY51266.1 Acetylornithine deacetylase/Succinyl-diaminopimelate desuccinylase [Pseudooceanicola antarcticus]
MAWQEYINVQQPRFVEELLEFVRIPSVSAKPENAGDVQRAAEWVVERLARAGIEGAEVLPTDGHPVVCAEWMGAGPDKPTVLIYGHFDVQPAEPFDLWTTPPFEPEVRDNKVWGRGASDDKGGMMVPILAVEAMLATQGKLPVNVKFFFEGQEEIGSPDLPPFVRANADRLKADMIFSADGLQWAPGQPQIVEALKGLISLEVHVQGPRGDLHSGLHGGGVANPAIALAQIIASMKSPDGAITIDGFYDDVVELSAEVREAIARVPFDEADYLAETGAPATSGEPGFSTRERLWGRPTLDVNGLSSGWQGAGTKTVLPAEASAKITCRLVANQSPETIYDLIEAHVAAHCPAGVTARVTRNPGRADPFLVPSGHNATAVATQVLEDVYGRAPYRTRAGGSIPVMTTLLETLGVHAVMFGFSHDDENLHAPDEFFRLDAFRIGQIAYCQLLETLGRS